MTKEESLKEAVDILEKDFGVKFSCEVVKDNKLAASIQPGKVVHVTSKMVELLSEDQLKSVIIHEAFHQIFPDLNETDLVEESQKRGIPFSQMPEYYEREVMTWNRVKEFYPKLESAVNELLAKSVPSEFLDNSEDGK